MVGLFSVPEGRNVYRTGQEEGDRHPLGVTSAAHDPLFDTEHAAPTELIF